MAVTKTSKKEEQKKLIVRIVCITLVVVLVVTSLLTVLPSLFQTETVDPGLQEMIDAGYAYIGEDGNVYLTDAYIELLTQSEESHEGHDHE